MKKIGFVTEERGKRTKAKSHRKQAIANREHPSSLL
jgi:hypothetical protein